MASSPIPSTTTKIAVERLLSALAPADAVVLARFAATTREYQRSRGESARGEPARADTTDVLIQQGIAAQRRATRLAEAFGGEPDAA